MLYPNLGEFLRISKRGNLIPVYEEILADMDTPVSAYLKLGGSPSFLLESVEGGEKWARYSFIGSRPSRIIKSWGNRVEIRDIKKGLKRFNTEDPLEIIKKEVTAYQPVDIKGLPRFYGGFVGYLGYDMVRFFERIYDYKRPGLGLPDMFFMLTDTMLIFDSLKQKIKIVSIACLEDKNPEDAYIEASKKINEIIRRLRGLKVNRRMKDRRSMNPEMTVKSTYSGFSSSFITEEAFEEAVLRGKEYIMSGDVVQVVLSQSFERDCFVNPFNIYRALRVINPSPYMYYLDTKDAKIIGSSPEILVRLEGGKIILRPIAGTRKRGETEEEDRALEEDLMKDPKERAEHIMLVDLGRNDVGRVAEIGSVKVTELMTVERYSHVMHLVSNIQGNLKKGLDAFDVLRSCFPAGTVTGAPKVRAMEIIDELEPTKRGIYAGAVGYFSFSGNMDTCITIRTLVIKDNKVYVQAGAGIVADSVPKKEYLETVNKAMGMMNAVEMAEKGLS